MQEGCTVNQTVRYISKKWMRQIILELYKGDNDTRHFSELQASLDANTEGYVQMLVEIFTLHIVRSTTGNTITIQGEIA